MLGSRFQVVNCCAQNMEMVGMERNRFDAACALNGYGAAEVALFAF
jgi:hypothetical protein